MRGGMVPPFKPLSHWPPTAGGGQVEASKTRVEASKTGVEASRLGVLL